MSRSIVTKFIAFVLAALTLVGAAASLLGIAVLGYNGLYDMDLEEYRQSYWKDQYYYKAYLCARSYAAEHLGGCPESVLEELYGNYYTGTDDSWSAVLMQDGQTLAEVGTMPQDAVRFEYTFTSSYPSLFPPVGTGTEVYPSNELTVWENDRWANYTLYFYNSPEYTVDLYLQPQLLENVDWTLLEFLYANRYRLIAVAAASILLLAICLVVLCCGAGRSPGSKEIRPAGLNRLPLDLYALGVGTLGAVCIMLGVDLAEWTFSDSIRYGGMILLTIMALALSVLILAFLFALAAQMKVRGGYWWRNTLSGRCIRGIRRGLRRLFRGIARFAALLPVVWQWLLTAALMALGLMTTFVLATDGSYLRWDGFFLLCFLLMVLACIGIVCYGAYCFGTLLSGVRRMNEGDLDHKIPTKYLLGAFREYALALNSLSQSAMVAAQKQLKSERMKTELITNVSHDIKTPLTSIINYVDLLQKPHSEQEQTQYLEVLSRQSLRLKKLIDDLMEMSKASTGNLTVEITKIDAAEAVNQALGEFSGKLAAARLIPVFTAPAEPVMMLADGRLVWRVLSNLLGNAVKYALPGTRLYIDTARVNDQVLISLKNISREQLNVSSEELMERFVRGDASRNTEGSGLGLNIAKSLMEVQKGQLSLLVDGDLFKVTLLFPGA